MLNLEITNIEGNCYATASNNVYDIYNKSKNAEIFEKLIDDLILTKYSDDESLVEFIKTLEVDEKRIAILSLIDGDHALWSKMDAYINGCSDKMEHIKNVVKIINQFVKDGEVEKKKFGEVMTPITLVREMLDTLPKEVWSNPNLKWLDPCNGAGTFPFVIIYKLMNGLKEWEPDTEKRYKHIIENMIYVCELQSRNVFLWLCGVDPKDEYTTNTYWGSFLDKEFDEHMKNVWGVEKFDIVVGNPPYQVMDGGNGASAKPIYNIFTEKSIKISNIILFITPSRWFGGGKGLDTFRCMMMSSNKIEIINHFDDASKIFGNSVEIKGGVSYFLFNHNHNNHCLFNNNKTNLNEFDIIVSKSEVNDIINKVSKYENLSKICHPRSYFGISTNDNRVSDSKINEDYLVCYTSKHKGFKKWIDKTHIKRESISYRVVTPRAATKGGEGFGNIFITKPNEYITDSYISFFVNDINEALSLKSYLSTNFSNYLLSLRKVSQTVKGDTCKWIPIVPFDRQWTDELLFEYFNISEEEKKLILE